MENFKIEIIKEILSKDIDEKTMIRILSKTQENYNEALNVLNSKEWEQASVEEKTKIMLIIGLGRNRTAMALKEYKVNRDNIKEAKASMTEEQTELRLKNESFITNGKIESTKRSKRMKHFEESNVSWTKLAERYKNGEPLHKISSEHGLKVNYITEQLKDDGIHDDTRSTLLKNKKALNMENEIDDNFIIKLVKENPLDGKYVLWEKAKIKYPWLLRKQMFDKLVELGLEKTPEQVNEIRGLKNTSNPELYEVSKGDSTLYSKSHLDNIISKYEKENPLYSRTKLSEKIKNENPELSIKKIKQRLKELDLGNKKFIRAQEIKANTLYKVDKVFGSLENLVELYMSNKLGSYSKIAKNINETCKEGLEVSVRQVEKAISRHPNYKPRQSAPELQLYEFTKKTFPNYEILREQQIPGTQKRMDILIKDLNVALEFNGDYYHSDEVIMFNYKKTSEEHHKERVEDAKKAGIKLVYVWERDWNINFLEVEQAIVNKDWDNPILNGHSNSDYHRKVKTPNPLKSTSKKKQDSN